MIHSHLRAVVGGTLALCLGCACLGAERMETSAAAVTGLDFSSGRLVPIPDDDGTGAADTITVVPSAPLGPVTAVAVDVDIRHARASELEVVLEHAETSEVLHEVGSVVGANLSRRFVVADAFDGLLPAGDWILRVYDRTAGDAGWLAHWSLHLEVEGDPSGEAEARLDARAELASGLAIPDGNRTGITSTLAVQSPVPGAFVTRVTVDVSIRHTDIGDLRVALVHRGQRVLLHNRSGKWTEDLSRSYAIDAAFDLLDPSGDWILEVADELSVDVGALEGWELHVYAATGPVDAAPSWDLTSTPQIAIPDGDRTGVTDTIAIPFWDADWLAAVPWSDRRHSVLVDVDIEHEFVGDLVVGIAHRDRSVVLQERRGGAQTNLVRTFRVDSEFARSPVDGEWTLRVVDAARIDVGTLRSWRLRIESIE